MTECHNVWRSFEFSLLDARRFSENALIYLRSFFQLIWRKRSKTMWDFFFIHIFLSYNSDSDKRSEIYYKSFERKKSVIIRDSNIMQELSESSALSQRAVYADVRFNDVSSDSIIDSSESDLRLQVHHEQQEDSNRFHSADQYALSSVWSDHSLQRSSANENTTVVFSRLLEICLELIE